MNSRDVRKQFIDFFIGKGHTFVPSSPVVPYDDPTLMFTNAGMNQFKDVFLGAGSRPYSRAANTQKCIRAGGKHNDLDDVGMDTYHHTFFEMLGNWSFGDYFKKEAIAWAWELLTKVWGIDKTRLHATYFQGDPAEGLDPDREAADLWRTATDIDPTHIHPGNKKDNFWEMGDTGPCGPCSEIHIDLTPDKSGGPLVNKGDARVMEVWNLVFIQFNRGSDSKLTPLPAKHVDTGMGFERICSVLHGMATGQLGKSSNYDTDVFAPIFDAIRTRTNAPAYAGTLPNSSRAEPQASACAISQTTNAPSNIEPSRGLKPAAQNSISNLQSPISNQQLMIDVSYRVIGDHLRTLTFALTDGALPSNEGRGYVLRRILRRAVRYGRQYLNMHEPFIADLVPALVAHMGEFFPELRESKAHGAKNQQRVMDLIRDEEASFLTTLDKGIQLFEGLVELTRRIATGDYVTEKRLTDSPSIEKLATGKWIHPREVRIFKQAGKNVIPGEAVFKLHSTFGFPYDLTKLMAQEEGLTVDAARFEELIEEDRNQSRARSQSSSGLEFSGASTLKDLVEAAPNETHFVGYEELETNRATILALYHLGEVEYGEPREKRVELLFEGQRGAFVLDTTPFYAEKGGQLGDIGEMHGDSAWMTVSKVLERNGRVIHFGYCFDGNIHEHSRVRAVVDKERRLPTMLHHTSTHILNWALRDVLEIHGDGKVDQKGSLVDPEKTRFDFSHNAPLTGEQIARIEKLCSDQLAANFTVFTKEVKQEDARKISTLRAVFGEKYPDTVRVVSVGADIDAMLADPTNPKWMQYSVEFCGGTHVKNTSDIKAFTLISEEGVAKGVRRVVGISGEAALRAQTLGTELLKEASALSEPQASACAISQTATASSNVEPSRGLKPAAQSLSDCIAAFSQRLTDVVIPLTVRHNIRAILDDLQKEAKKQDKQAAADAGGAVMDKVASLFAAAKTIGGTTVVVGEVPAAPVDALRGAIDWIRNKTPACAVLLAIVDDNKVTLMAGMSKAVVEKGIKAGDLIKEIAPLVGGKGGGRPDMAQGGGPDAAGLPQALTKANEWLASKLG